MNNTYNIIHFDIKSTKLLPIFRNTRRVRQVQYGYLIHVVFAFSVEMAHVHVDEVIILKYNVQYNVLLKCFFNLSVQYVFTTVMFLCLEIKCLFMLFTL